VELAAVCAEVLQLIREAIKSHGGVCKPSTPLDSEPEYGWSDDVI
jgi:hypothetical protein